MDHVCFSDLRPPVSAALRDSQQPPSGNELRARRCVTTDEAGKETQRGVFFTGRVRGVEDADPYVRLIIRRDLRFSGQVGLPA